MMKSAVLLVCLFALNAVPCAVAEDQSGQIRPIELNDPIPYGQRPFDYFESSTLNPVAELEERLSQGETQLTAEGSSGYLNSVLNELGISPASQMLVFSKTALNPKLVSPKSPRAIYFNENTYVGWVPGATTLELAVVDPEKGWVFYTLLQPEAMGENSKPATPIIKRETQCLACHAGQSTLRIPGGLVRGFVTDASGNPLSGYSRITHEMPFGKRFGGWYVTGSHGQMTHQGNRIDSKTGPVIPLLSNPNNLDDLTGAIESGLHLKATSDVVAQMVLHHQVHGQNLLIRVGYEARLGLRSNAEDLLVQYLLFAEEAPLAELVKGDAEFTRWFQSQGQEDSPGRTLREFDLKTRLFKYRLSYLIDSALFDHLPKAAKQRIYEKLWSILTTDKPPAPFITFPPDERNAILKILREVF